MCINPVREKDGTAKGDGDNDEENIDSQHGNYRSNGCESCRYDENGHDQSSCREEKDED
jgi:hypothetical protein